MFYLENPEIGLTSFKMELNSCKGFLRNLPQDALNFVKEYSFPTKHLLFNQKASVKINSTPR